MSAIPSPHPAEQLLLLMSLHQLDAAERRRAQAVAAEVTDWSALWTLADHNRTAPLTYHNLQQAEILHLVPAAVADRFRREAERIQLANEARLVVAREMIARFAERKIPIVILKGVLFAETIYRHPGYKRMNDIDILVRLEDLDAIYDIYEEMKLFSAAELVGGDPREQEKFSHHAPPFFSRDLRCMIGTHWGLITPLAPYRLDYEAIWSRVTEIDFYGLPARSMAAEDNLHHLCVHLPYYKTGVRELADIYNLIRFYRTQLDWDLFIGEVRKARSEGPVYHALSLANRLVPSAEAEAVASRLRSRVPWFLRNDTARKTRHLDRLLNARSVHMSRIEKAYGDLRNTKKPQEMWSAYGRMWYHLLAPPVMDVARLNSLDPGDWLKVQLARPITPVRIFRVFQFDLGPWVPFVMLFKCALDASKQTVKVAQGEQVTDMAHHAASVGITLEQLQRLKDGLE